jgi:hypothetical protein
MQPVERTRVPTPIPSATLYLTPTDTPSPLPTAIHTYTPQPLPTGTGTPEPTYTSQPTPTAMPTSAPLPAATATALPTWTPVPEPGVITGRVLMGGAPATQSVTLVLEDNQYRAIREVVTSGGEYRFDGLAASDDGYHVVFSHSRNPQFEYDDVVGWSWVGPMRVRDGDVIRLPDMEIGLLGLHQTNPSLDAFVSTASITQERPLVFTWTPYPSASSYWLELRSGSAQRLVWESDFVTSTSVDFEGPLSDGTLLAAGSYWWRVSARIGDGAVTVSGPLAGFTLIP